MRADRLVQIVMMLQARGSATAERLAREFGVSQRTIYRDMEALDAAGVPIVAEAGPSGGYTLMRGYRSELTGLTVEEVAALGLLAVPEAAAELGVSDALRRAVAKVLASVPRFASSAGERVRERILVNPVVAGEGAPVGTKRGDDRGGSGEALRPPTVLGRLQEAALANRRVDLTVALPFSLRVTQRADALGLVFADGRWHAVVSSSGGPGRGDPRVLPVSVIVEVTDAGEEYECAPAFDLREFWTRYSREARARARAFAFDIRVAPAAVADARRVLGVMEPAGPSSPREEGLEPGAPVVLGDPVDWPRYRCAAPDLAAARSALLSLGGAAEVISPVELRSSVADYAGRAADRYR